MRQRASRSRQLQACAPGRRRLPPRPLLRPGPASMLQGGVTKTSPWWRAIWVALALLGFCWLLVQLRSVLSPVLFAFLLAYLLDPLVDRFETWQLPRSVGIVILLFAAVLGITLFVVLVIP